MRECFGTIYPDLMAVECDREFKGKVFSVCIHSLGLTHGKPELKIDRQEWEDCQDCECYESCFALSNAKLAMQHALQAI